LSNSENSEAKAPTPKLSDFCEKCRPLAKQILDEIQARLIELKRKE